MLGLPWLQELGTSEMSNWMRDHGVVATAGDTLTHLPGHLVLEAVRNGDGVSLSTRVNVERDLAAGRLLVLFEEAEPGPRLPHRHPAGRACGRRSAPSSPGSAATPATGAARRRA